MNNNSGNNNDRKFPTESIKKFLTNPTMKNLNSIRYVCPWPACRGCVFDNTGACPPPYPYTRGYFTYINNQLRQDREDFTLAQIVLILSEILAKYELKHKRKGG